MIGFNLEDLKKGGISKEAFDGIVNRIILRVDEKRLTNDEITKMKSDLQNALSILFKPNFRDFPFHQFPESWDYKQFINNQITVKKKRLARIRIMESEAHLLHLQEEKLLKELDASLEALEASRQADQANAAITAAKHANLRAEHFQRLMAYHDLLDQQLKEIRQARKDIAKSIDFYQKMISASRKKAIDKITVYANEVQVNGVHTFQGLSEAQIKEFIRNDLAIEELTQKKLIELEAKHEQRLDDETKKRDELIENDPTGKMRYQKNFDNAKRRLHGEYIVERDKAHQTRDELRKQNLQSVCPHIPPEDIPQHLQAFDNDKDIKRAKDEHIETAKVFLKQTHQAEVQDKVLEQQETEVQVKVVEVGVELGRTSDEHQAREEVENITAEVEELATEVKEYRNSIVNDIKLSDDIDSSDDELLAELGLDLDDLDLSGSNLDEVNFEQGRMQMHSKEKAELEKSSLKSAF